MESDATTDCKMITGGCEIHLGITEAEDDTSSLLLCQALRQKPLKEGKGKDHLLLFFKRTSIKTFEPAHNTH